MCHNFTIFFLLDLRVLPGFSVLINKVATNTHTLPQPRISANTCKYICVRNSKKWKGEFKEYTCESCRQTGLQKACSCLSFYSQYRTLPVCLHLFYFCRWISFNFEWGWAYFHGLISNLQFFHLLVENIPSFSLFVSFFYWAIHLFLTSLPY